MHRATANHILLWGTGCVHRRKLLAMIDLIGIEPNPGPGKRKLAELDAAAVMMDLANDNNDNNTNVNNAELLYGLLLILLVLIVIATQSFIIRIIALMLSFSKPSI